MDHDLEKAQNMQLLLSAFEQVSRLKINFHKSELFCFRITQDHLDQCVKQFGRKSGDFPIRYLGILYILGSLEMLNGRRLRNTLRGDWVVGTENIFQLGDA